MKQFQSRSILSNFNSTKSSCPLSELEKVKRMNEANIKSMQTQINNVKNKLRNEIKNSIQASMSNQINELKNMMASFFQMNIASTSGSRPLPSNTIANPKGELKSITTQSGIVLDGPFVPIPPPFINPEKDECEEETLTDQDLAEYTIKVPHPLVQKSKHPSQRNFVVHQRDHLHPNILYTSRMHKQKQQEKDEVQIYKFWQMFNQLHINITLADALILIPKYQKMLKALFSNKEKLLELANTPLNENCSAVILKKLLEKLGDPGKFLIPCVFSELKCKALADLGASINLMPLSVSKKVCLPELISTGMTLELANWAICTPAGITRDVFVSVGKFTFLADFVIVDYESDPRVPLILGRPFLRTARALIDIHEEEMILRDEDLVLIEKLINIDSTKDLPPPHNINPLSGSTTSPSPNQLFEEFADKLALITFLPGNDDLSFDIESDLKEIEYLLNHDPIKDMDYILEDWLMRIILLILMTILLIPSPRCSPMNMLLIIHPLCYTMKMMMIFLKLSPTLNMFMMIHLTLRFSKVDALPSTNNEDKVFNLGILIQENLFEVITQVAPDKNVKNFDASLILKDFDHPLFYYELPFHKEVLGSKILLSFSSKNEEKVFKTKILASKGGHSSLLSEVSHRDPNVFKIIKIIESLMEVFPCSFREDIRILDVPCLYFHPL
nr:reverse transcriptase domain-containing protein [Tanacetum cinerariifolium]